ncbi:hypothetical protein Tco_0179975 [Tanacetum coccineum]
MACSLPHTDSEVEALVQRLINEDKGRQDALLELAFRFEDSCAVRDDIRKAYEKCNDISQESRALICTLLKEITEKDRKLHISMYGKAVQLEKQMGAKLAWFQEKYSCRTCKGIDSSSSQANCSLTEKELHKLRMDEEAQRETLEEEVMNKKAQEEKIRQKQAEDDVFFLEFGIVRYIVTIPSDTQASRSITKLQRFEFSWCSSWRVASFMKIHKEIHVVYTSSKIVQMHNNIMTAGSKDRPPMLGPGRYSQWRSRFLRYIDTKPKGGGLKKSILSGPYVPTTVQVQAVEAA